MNTLQSHMHSQWGDKAESVWCAVGGHKGSFPSFGDAWERWSSCASDADLSFTHICVSLLQKLITRPFPMHVTIWPNTYCVRGVVLTSYLRSHSCLYSWMHKLLWRFPSDFSFQHLVLQILDHVLEEKLLLESWLGLAPNVLIDLPEVFLSSLIPKWACMSNIMQLTEFIYLLRASCQTGD